MAANSMKQDMHFPRATALPDAPLAMPKQQLEARRRPLFAALRIAFSVFAVR